MDAGVVYESPVEILTVVREALSDPARWMRGLYWEAEDSPRNAHCACLVGACIIAGDPDCHTVPPMRPHAVNRAVDALAAVIAGDDPHAHLDTDAWVTSFNDDERRTHEDILQVLDRAITLAENEAER